MFAGAILAGMEKTRALFIQQLWGTTVAVCLVLPFILHSGLQAAVEGWSWSTQSKPLSGWYMVYAARPTEAKSIIENVAVASVSLGSPGGPVSP